MYIREILPYTPTNLMLILTVSVRDVSASVDQNLGDKPQICWCEELGDHVNNRKEGSGALPLESRHHHEADGVIEPSKHRAHLYDHDTRRQAQHTTT